MTQQSNKKQKRPGARAEPPTRTISAPAFHATLGRHAAGGTCPICAGDLPANLLAINLHIGTCHIHSTQQLLTSAKPQTHSNHILHNVACDDATSNRR